MGMRTCRDCGTAISKRAKTCPHCGAHGREIPPVLAYGLILVVVVAVILGFINSSP